MSLFLYGEGMADANKKTAGMAAVSHLCQMPFQKPTRLADGLGHGSVLFMMKFAPKSGSPASMVSMDLGYIVVAVKDTLMM